MNVSAKISQPLAPEASGPKPLRSAEVAARLRATLLRGSRRLRQQANPATVSPALLGALGVLEREGPLTPSELANREHIKRPTATGVIARLEAEGLVTRARDPNDARSCSVAVAPAGKELLATVRRRRDAYLARALSRLDPDELATLERGLSVLERILAEEPR